MPLTLLNTFLAQSRERDKPKIILSLTPLPKNRWGLGRLAALASVNEEGRRGLKSKAQIFISQILKYYEDLPEILGLTPKKIAAEKDKLNLFEKTLERANFLAPQTFSEEEINGLNIVLAHLSDRGTQFSGRGSFSSHLLCREDGQDKILNLRDEYNQSGESGRPFFGNLVSGSVSADDFFVLAVGDVFDYLSINRLQKLLRESTAEEASLFIEKNLSQMNSPPFGGIIASWPPKLRAPKNITLREFRLLSDAAIKKLIRQKGLNEVKPKLKEAAVRLKNILDTVYIYLKRIPPASRVSLRNLSGQFRNIVEQVRLRWNKRPKALPDLFAHYRDPAAVVNFYLQHRKTALWAAPLLLVLLAGAVFGQYASRQKLHNEENNQVVKKIQGDLDEAESNLIYKNEERALTVLEEARRLLTELPADLPAWLKLRQNLTGLEDKINHRRVVAPKTVERLPSDVKLTAADLTFVYNKNTYSLDSSSKQILKNGIAWLKESLPPDAKIVSLAVDGSVYLALTNGQILKFSRGAKDNFEIRALSPPLRSALKIFTSPDLADLYILEPQTKRVVAINKKTGLVSAQYLAEEFANLENLTVKDKTVYLLSGSNGSTGSPHALSFSVDQ